MASALLYTVLLLLISTVEVIEYARISGKDRCVLHPPCLDLITVERMTQRVSKNVPAVDRENILLKSQTFDKIRKKKTLHSCVLRKIIDFFEDVLQHTWQQSSGHGFKKTHLKLISIMERVKGCTYKVKRCAMLYQKATRQPNSEISEADIAPEAVAVVQLQKLNYASKRLHVTHILEGAMDELKSLHHYIPGRGFRKRNG